MVLKRQKKRKHKYRASRPLKCTVGLEGLKSVLVGQQLRSLDPRYMQEIVDLSWVQLSSTKRHGVDLEHGGGQRKVASHSKRSEGEGIVQN